MRTKKRIEITVEADQVWVIRRRGGSVGGRCATCAAPVQMVTPEEAVAVAGVGLRTIYRWVEEGRLHITETADGLFRICLNSLLR